MDKNNFDFMPGEVVVGLKTQNTNLNPVELFPELDIAEIEDLYEPLVALFDSSYVYDPAYEISNKQSCENVNQLSEINLGNIRGRVKEEKLDRLKTKARTVYVIKLSEKSDDNVWNAIELLKENPLVAYAEPNYISSPAVANFPNVPNDSEFHRLWGMNKIMTPQAWGISTGSHTVEVGVLDSGFYYKHPDLNSNMDVHYAAGMLYIIGRNGTRIPEGFLVENADGVRYATLFDAIITHSEALVSARALVPGPGGETAAGTITRIVNPMNNISSVTNPHRFGLGLGANATSMKFSGMDGFDISDQTGHGTHVAGTIGAVGNNEIGVAGVNWQVKMIPIKIASVEDITRTSVAIQTRAVEYATLLDLPVINMSYGIVPSELFQKAIHGYNGLFVMSAGNQNRDLDDASNPINEPYTSAHALGNVIFVGAIDDKEDRPIWDLKYNKASNYGINTVDIAAPGISIFSTNVRHTSASIIVGSPYSGMNGTSMAAPHVAGAAALLLSVNPGLTAGELKTAILDNADIIPSLQIYFNRGRRLNVYRSILSVLPIISAPIIPLVGGYKHEIIGISTVGVFKGRDLHIVVNKRNDSNTIDGTVTDSISINADGRSEYELPESLNSFSLQVGRREHTEILVFDDPGHQRLLTRHFVQPIVMTPV